MHQNKPNYLVFISSTFLDNQERRKLVEDAIQRASMQAVGMERFTASARPTVEYCENQARGCDVYVGIIAHRYGWIPDGQPLSITELEYDAAKAAGRPCLLFEIDESVPVDKRKDYDEGPDRWAKQDKLDAFRAKYRQDQMPAPFTETTLGTKVLDALNQWRNQPPVDASKLERYRQTVLSIHSYIPLAGFKTKLRVPIALEELYVPLHAMLDLRANGASRFADADEAEAKLRECGSLEIPLIEAFREAQQRRRRGLVILGDPGSGKTTHLKRLLLYCFKEGPAGLGLPVGTVPVFLPLRDLDDLTCGIDAFIEKTLDSPHLDMSKGFGQRLLQGQPLLLLFDGLDEVSDPRRRAQVSRWIEQAAQARPHCTAVVTCRFAGYDDKDQLGAQFLELHLRPLTPEQSNDFIGNWYRAVETGLAGDTASTGLKAEEGAASLIERLRQPDFRSARMVTLIRNPLLLANLCLVHRDRGALPHNRHQLYDECIDVLLEHWREVKSLPVSVPAELGRRALQPAALWLHQEQGRTRATAAQLAPQIEPVLQHRHWPGGDATALLRAVRDESGLLTGWGQDQFGFMHLGFQEYLAACELRRLACKLAFEGDTSAVLRNLAAHHADSWWQEVILLLLAQGNPSLFAPFMTEVLKLADFDPAGALAGLILEEAAEASAEPFLQWLQQPLGGDAAWTKWTKRQRAVLPLLQQLMPPDFEPVLHQVSLHHLPDHAVTRQQARIQEMAENQTEPSTPLVRITANGNVELVLIPGSRFAMGSPNGEGYESEHPLHEVEIRPFYLGKYPITNEEYARFLRDNPNVIEPEYWGDRRFNQARQPVVGVSWGDAYLFAAWAGGRLPSEAEWEYACRAGTSTRYWWGDEFENQRANCAAGDNQWGGARLSSVGSFEPNSFGLYDTSGNVWEWVQDRRHDSYIGAPDDGSAWEKVVGNGWRVVRGGSWNNFQQDLRSATRGRSHPGTRNYGIGFRLAQDL